MNIFPYIPLFVTIIVRFFNIMLYFQVRLYLCSYVTKEQRNLTTYSYKLLIVYFSPSVHLLDEGQVMLYDITAN